MVLDQLRLEGGDVIAAVVDLAAQRLAPDGRR